MRSTSNSTRPRSTPAPLRPHRRLHPVIPSSFPCDMLSACVFISSIHKNKNIRFALKALAFLFVLMATSIAIYQAHRVASSEYYRSCSSNMFVALFIKDSRYCKMLRWMILLLETKFVEVAKIAATNIMS